MICVREVHCMQPWVAAGVGYASGSNTTMG